MVDFSSFNTNYSDEMMSNNTHICPLRNTLITLITLDDFIYLIDFIVNLNDM